MTAAAPGPLVRTSARMNAQEYVRILEENLVPYIREVVPGGQVSFIQDNCPVHKAAIVDNYFHRNEEIEAIQWPAHSPDLNPIENLWRMMVKEWQPRGATTVEELEAHVHDLWNAFRRRPHIKFSGINAQTSSKSC